MKIEIWFQQSNVPITYEARATYQKGDMFCIGYEDGEEKRVDKYPVWNIFRVRESGFASSLPRFSACG